MYGLNNIIKHINVKICLIYNASNGIFKLQQLKYTFCQIKHIIPFLLLINIVLNYSLNNNDITPKSIISIILFYGVVKSVPAGSVGHINLYILLYNYQYIQLFYE